VAEDVRALDAEVVEQPDDVACEAGYVMSRSMSAVRPCAWNSIAMTRCFCASVGMRSAKVRSIVITPPCSRTSGVPCSPWIS
jgi:hypothetical protein